MTAVTFPFTEESVKSELCDKPLVKARHVMGSSEFLPGETFMLRTDGSCSLGNWNVAEGALELTDARGKRVCLLDGVEVRNGELYLDGESLREADKQGFVEAAVWPVQPVGPLFDVTISSHVDYWEVTTSRLIRSLVRAGVEKDSITVVVGGSTDPKERHIGGVAHHFVEQSLFEFQGFMKYGCFNEYVLLLHDTCEATEDFGKLAQSVDTGPAADAVVLECHGRLTPIGFWRTEYLDWALSKCSLETVRPTAILNALLTYTRVWMRMPSEQQTMPPRDVYGDGVIRQPVYLTGLGLKKYLGSVVSGGKP